MLMAFAFLGLAISGIIMYIAPPCSVADRLGWTVMALSKDQWASMHQVTAVFILVLAIIHLFIYNWKTFMCYLRDMRSKRQADRDREGGGPEGKRFRVPRELIAALVVAAIMYAGALTFIAPFGWLHDGSDAIKEHYRQETPPGSGRGLGAGDREGHGAYVSPDRLQETEQLTPEVVQKEGRGLGTGKRDGTGQGQRRGSQSRATDAPADRNE